MVMLVYQRVSPNFRKWLLHKSDQVSGGMHVPLMVRYITEPISPVFPPFGVMLQTTLLKKTHVRNVLQCEFQGNWKWI